MDKAKLESGGFSIETNTNTYCLGSQEPRMGSRNARVHLGNFKEGDMECGVEVGFCWQSNPSFENIWSSLSVLVGTDPWDTFDWETKLETK